MTLPWWWRAACPDDGSLQQGAPAVLQQLASLGPPFEFVINFVHEVSARRCGAFGGCLISTRP